MMRYWVGVDFGESPDATAIAVVERRSGTGTADEQPYTLLLRWMHTVEPPVDYEDVSTRIAEMLWKLEPYRTPRKGLPYTEPEIGLAVDARGVGRGVRPILERAIREKRALVPGPRIEFWPIQTTGGNTTTASPPFINVSKRDVVHSSYQELRAGRLILGDDAPGREITRLREQLINYRLKFTRTGHDAYEPWKSTQHDDLVDALNLAVYAWTHQRGD